jgi:hypothetical protein
MRLTGIVSIAIVILCNPGCVTTRSSDFKVTSKFVQHIPVPSSHKVVVSCYCSNRTSAESDTVRDIELHFVGSLSSVGYHGNQKSPTAVPIDLMQFKVSEQPDELKVESKEFTYIHHAFFLNNLEVLYPPGVTVSFEPVPSSALEGRRVQ